MQVCKTLTKLQGKHVYVRSDSDPRIKYEIWTGTLGKTIPTCECESYKWSKDDVCKHIRRIFNKTCGWGEEWSDDKQNSRQRKAMLCPLCGSKTMEVKYALT